MMTPVRQALTIGINAYKPDYLRLEPCINDATDLSISLRSIGFYTRCARDLDSNSMQSVVRRFVESIQPGAIVLFYFSGHGIQYNGDNYLIATDATGICSDNIKSIALDVQKLITQMHTKHPRLTICILDCCRTKPPSKSIDEKHRFDNTLKGTKPGLAPMQAPSSTIIAYACAANDGASAQSKNDRNSLYTYHLLRYIRMPNIDIENVLRYVAADVQKDSNNEQIPFRYSSCNESICLVPSLGQNVPLLPLQYMQMRANSRKSLSRSE